MIELKRPRPAEASKAMRGAAVVTLALALVCSAISAPAQQQRDVKPGTDMARKQDLSKLGTRSVTGTVKKTTDNGLVVVGRETGQADKEWRFPLMPALVSTLAQRHRLPVRFGRVMPSR